ncbi:ATP-dependent helicase [Thermomonas brevis]|uniref:ATP-dependent helicase n=1 Tax=Thermomonas brevis TaxID=215691 RepID=UPI001CB6F0E3|nr:ATP-dependent DNA helicase [Thermomonas brevis]
MPDISPILRRELRSPQADAALDDRREVLCIACAGSGKSQTLAYRVARLVASGVDPESIVVFTFTEKAAESIKNRTAQVLVTTGQSANLLGKMFIGTIHGFCQNVLGDADARYRQYDVLDGNRFKLFLISRYPRLAIGPLRRRNNDRYFDTLKSIQYAWNVLRDEGVTIEQVAQLDPELAESLSAIEQEMERDQFIDFASMIRLVVDKARNDARVIARLTRIRHLLVDEYQDVSGSQEDLIATIHRLGSSIFVVGDDDQSIYGWRGAIVQNILEFETRYPNAGRHTLDENFRSTRAIVETSDAFARAELGASRLDKAPRHVHDLLPRQVGVMFFDQRGQEADWVADRIHRLMGTTFAERDGTQRGLTPADFAILMRSTKTAEQSGVPRHVAFSEALATRGIKYTLSAGGNAFERPIPRGLRELFRSFENGNPTRAEAIELLRVHLIGSFPYANEARFLEVITRWGRDIHRPHDAVRVRLYPQKLLLDVLEALDLPAANLSAEDLRDIGLFSRILQDVEGVFLSVDSADRFRSIVRFMENVAEDGYDTSTDDVVAKPDAVTISTVHQVKGLEFPVVFVVDVVPGRFPGKRSSYDGWIPEELIGNSVGRGAYIGTSEAEARLFYTAMTRAERFLYVTGCESLPGGKRRNRQSVFAARLGHDELTRDSALEPEALTQSPPRARVDSSMLPTSYSDVKYYLRCPADYRFRKGYGFSPPVPELFGYGRVVHVAIEKLHEIYFGHAPTREEAAEIAAANFHLKHIAPSRDPDTRPGAYENAKSRAQEIAAEYVDSYANDFSHRRQVEVRFELTAQGCLITGAIDLLMRYSDHGQILEAQVIDFKTMEGGEDVLANRDLEWTEMALQVQLYAKAAREVLGEDAATGSIHLLKDNQRVEVPIDEHSVDNAIANVEWAVAGILANDFPMRPERRKCEECDFKQICARRPQDFRPDMVLPPSISTPAGQMAAQSLR